MEFRPCVQQWHVSCLLPIKYHYSCVDRFFHARPVDCSHTLCTMTSTLGAHRSWTRASKGESSSWHSFSILWVCAHSFSFSSHVILWSKFQSNEKCCLSHLAFARQTPCFDIKDSTCTYIFFKLDFVSFNAYFKEVKFEIIMNSQWYYLLLLSD